MLLALLPGVLLALWGLGALFDDADSDDDDPTPEEDYAAQGTLVQTPEGDILYGTWESDLIRGTDGDDWVTGEAPPDAPRDPEADNSWNDTIYLGAGDDVFANPDGWVNEGDDLVRGGAGNDRLDLLGFGDSTVYGDQGDDIINVRDLDFYVFDGDTVYGGDGDDTIVADDGDIVSGGPGQDSYVFYEGDCNAFGSFIITDYQPGETLEVHVDYHPNPGLHTVTPLLSADGQSQVISSQVLNTPGQAIILQGVTDLQTV